MTATWRKSSQSNNNGACVEVAQVSEQTIAVRDSKLDTVGDFPRLALDRADWAGFLGGLRRDDLT